MTTKCPASVPQIPEYEADCFKPCRTTLSRPHRSPTTLLSMTRLLGWAMSVPPGRGHSMSRFVRLRATGYSLVILPADQTWDLVQVHTFQCGDAIVVRIDRAFEFEVPRAVPNYCMDMPALPGRTRPGMDRRDWISARRPVAHDGCGSRSAGRLAANGRWPGMSECGRTLHWSANRSASMTISDAVVGAAVHYARAEFVTVGVEGGTPVFVDRRRIELIDASIPIAPYHHEALKLSIGAAIELVSKVRRSVARHASQALSTMLATYRAKVLILAESPHDSLLESLEEILKSRPLTFAADGMLYRESLAEAAVDLGLDVRRFPRRADLPALAAESLGMAVSAVTALISRFGREAGPPWRKDHKLAAAAALSVVGRKIRG